MHTSHLLGAPACEVLMRESRLVIALQEAHATQKRALAAEPLAAACASTSIATMPVAGPTAIELAWNNVATVDNSASLLPNVPASLFGSPCFGYGGVAVAIVQRPRRLRSDDPHDVLVQIRGHMGYMMMSGVPLADCSPPEATPMCSLAARLHRLSPTCWLCTVARPGLIADWFVIERAWAIPNPPRTHDKALRQSYYSQPLWALIWSDAFTALAPHVPPQWPRTAKTLAGLGAFSGVDMYKAFGLSPARDDEDWPRILLSHDKMAHKERRFVFACEFVHRLRRRRRRELLSSLRALGAMLELRTCASMEVPAMARCVQSDNLLEAIVDAVGIENPLSEP